MSQDTILVTGANGFVGGSIVRALCTHGQSAVGLVRRGRTVDRGAGVREIAAWSREELSDAVRDASCVVHAASVVHRPGARQEEYDRFNIDGTRALVEACRARGVSRLVFLSTIKVYGETPPSAINESTPAHPEGGYASSKLAAERIVLEASERGLSAIVLRLCPVFGPGDKGNVRTMIRALWRRRLVIPGDGSTRKSLVHISTVTDVVRAATASEAGGVFVVADRVAPSIREIADTIADALKRRRPRAMPVPLLMAGAAGIEAASRLLGRDPPIDRHLIRKSLTPTICSPERAERELGVVCHVNLPSAIQDEVSWLRSAGLL